ncbi:MAG: T9SS type A sorting domain-containing protein [Flavobacterium sp.]|nr:T9SS type A sorting domain-containing protein [Flavobacterium sp.]
MKKKIQNQFILLLGLLYSITGISQVIFSQNLNSSDLGTYTLEQVKKEFVTTSANGFTRKGVGENRVTIVKTGTTKPSGRCLKVKYPKDKADTKDSGANWETKLNGNYQELYLSYYVKFDGTFDFINNIGKLPGLAGGLSFEDNEKETEWSGKLMWRLGAKIQFYLHQPITNEKQYFWNEGGVYPTFKRNKWYHIEIHYKLNTITGSKANKNGIMEAWLDGKLVGKYTNIQFRSKSGVGINSLFFSTFFGGNVEDDAPSKDEYAFFDEFIVSKSRIGYTARITDEEIVSSEETDSIIIYPNPSKNLITLTGLSQNKSEISIYNLMGLKLISKTVSNNSSIDLSSLSAGNYILMISTENNSPVTKTFIKE